MGDNSLKIFKVVCNECEQAGEMNQQTNIHINWEKRFYVISCMNPKCNAYEIFNEKGERMVIPEHDEEKNETPEKIIN